MRLGAGVFMPWTAMLVILWPSGVSARSAYEPEPGATTAHGIRIDPGRPAGSSDTLSMGLSDTVVVEAKPYEDPAVRAALLYGGLRSGRRGLDHLRLEVPVPSIPLAAPRRLSLVERTAYGADAGAYAGLMLGGVGHLIGLWDEKTAWALTGSGAALGSIWGTVVGSERSSVRLGIVRDP